MLDDSGTVPGPAPLRRLTLVEYQNTVRDLLGIETSAVADQGLAERPGLGLSGFFRGSALTTGTDARAFMNLAERRSAKLAAGKARLAGPLQADPRPRPPPRTPAPISSSTSSACAPSAAR